MRYAWSRLNRQQKGTYGEYVAKMEFVMYGYLVFSAEIDDRGVDFVVRNDAGRHFDVQVKTVTHRTTYTCITESKFSENLWICLVVLTEGVHPTLYLFSGRDWISDESDLLRRNHFQNAKEAEYGIHIAKKRVSVMKQFAFDQSVERLREEATYSVAPADGQSATRLIRG